MDAMAPILLNFLEIGYMKLSLIDVIGYPNKAIVALTNMQDKVIYITYSSNPVAFLFRNITQLKDNTHPNKSLLKDKDLLEFWILSPLNYNISKTTANYHMAQAFDLYGKLGFSFYNSPPKPITITPKVEYINKSCCVTILGITIKKFKDAHDANVFISSNSLDTMLSMMDGCRPTDIKVNGLKGL